MLRELTDYRAQKTWFQAVIYYISWLILLLAAVGVPVSFVMRQMGASEEHITYIGGVTAFIVGEYLVWRIISTKSLEGAYLLAYPAQAVLCLLGILPGLLIPAWLTTVSDKTDIFEKRIIPRQRL